MSLTPELRQLRSRQAAYAKWATTDAKQGTAAARDARWQGFLNQVDPDRQLPEDERVRRATAARNAHMAKMAYLSAKARSGRAEA